MWHGNKQLFSILFFILMSQISALEEDNSLENFWFEDSKEAVPSVNQIEPREFFTSWQMRRAVRKILKQMPCGWPQYEIPPLAPYKNDNLTFRFANDFISAFSSLKLLQIDGLNDMDIDQLNVDIMPHRIDFDFNFSNITTTGNFKIFMALIALNELDLQKTIHGKGDLDLSLENLRINGTFQYKMPLIFGSAKIYNLTINMSLANVRSALTGNVNKISITKLNQQIEKSMLKYFNEYQRFVSPLLSHVLETQINSQLEDKKLWNVIWWAMGKNSDECVVEQAQESN